MSPWLFQNNEKAWWQRFLTSARTPEGNLDRQDLVVQPKIGSLIHEEGSFSSDPEEPVSAKV